jgi:hypothetical protein
MPILSETEALEAMSKSQLIELLKLYAQLLLTVDGLWFMGTEKTRGVDDAIKLDKEVWRQFGMLEANRMKKFLGMDSIVTLEDFFKIILLSPMWVSVGTKAEIQSGRSFFSVTNCHSQKARIRQGLGEFPCKSVGEAYLEGFVPALNPNLKYRCVFCPPDQHPENEWCKWEVGWF